MINLAEEAIVNIRTVKAFANEDKEVDRFYGGNLKVYNIRMKL